MGHGKNNVLSRGKEQYVVLGPMDRPLKVAAREPDDDIEKNTWQWYLKPQVEFVETRDAKYMNILYKTDTVRSFTAQVYF